MCWRMYLTSAELRSVRAISIAATPDRAHGRLPGLRPIFRWQTLSLSQPPGQPHVKARDVIACMRVGTAQETPGTGGYRASYSSPRRPTCMLR